jgi:hypothetical protein
MEGFPFLFHHPFQPFGLYFEDADEELLSDFVDNVSDRAF